MHVTFRLIPLVLAGALGAGWAASPVIGVAQGRGSFRLDGATVQTNGTLFDGNAIETGEVATELRLAGGARLMLASGSRGRVYRDHLVLEGGSARLQTAEDYPIEARSLRVVPAGRGATAQVVLSKERAGSVEVAALNGPVRVTSAQGLLVAQVFPGRALQLTPQVAAAASRLTGCLRTQDGKFLLTDETTNVTVELQGEGLAKEAGNIIEIVGATIPGAKPAAGATQVIRISELKQTGRKCTSGPPVPVPVAVGISTGAKVAIIGGVVAATSVGAAYASGAFEDERPISP